MDTTAFIGMCPIHIPSPTITALSGGSYFTHRRRALHFIFVQSGLRQDPLDLFQDRFISAIVFFRERKPIAPKKFSSVVTALARLLSPIHTCKCARINLYYRGTVASNCAGARLPKRKAKTYENARRKRQAPLPEGAC